MKKSIIKLSILTLLLTSLVSCNNNDNTLNFHTETYTVNDYSSEYEIKNKTLQTYFLDDGQVPYVDVNDFIDSLNGFFNSSAYNVKNKINKLFDTYELYWYSGTTKYSFQVNWNKNKIKVNDDNVFYFINSGSATNYSYNLKSSSYLTNASQSIEYDLNNYGIDIYYYNNKVLMPFAVLNLLFCSQAYLSVYFNGDAYWVYDIYYTNSDESYNEIRNNKYTNTLASKDMREMSLNFLEFALDYYYGLKNYYNIDTFKNYISDEIKQQILSTDPNEFTLGYLNLLQKNLDELHTNFSQSSFYNASDAKYNLLGEDYTGETWSKYYTLYEDLNKEAKEKLGSQYDDYLRLGEHTAVITFNSFDTGSNSELYNKDGTVKDDAYKYDTFFLMKKAMDEIESRGGIENIIIDLTRNGGGNVGAMYRVLGFLTDDYIISGKHNYLNQQSYFSQYLVDTNSDGNYTDQDSYSKYNWNVLTSYNTFSAANSFTAIVQAMDIANVIGETTGGGMCSIMPVILPDGTTIRISSPNAEMQTKMNGNYLTYKPIQGGITPDYQLDQEYFYNDFYLANYVRNFK